MKQRAIRIISALALFALGFFSRSFFAGYVSMSLFVLAWVTAGYDVVFAAVKNIVNGEVFDENLLMSIASAGAFVIGEHAEGAAVMIFYQIGELFQERAVGSARRSIAELMDIRPDYANLVSGDSFERVSPSAVSEGDLILIKPGEKVPLDCLVVEGSSTVDTSALTGESIPREAYETSELLAGFINKTGLLRARVLRSYRQSAVSRILELVENSAARKSRAESFITKFARIYTPLVVAAAALLAFFPPFVLGMGDLSTWGYRALTFLVVSCPCALVISVPLGFFGGIGGASRRGILFKGSSYLEALARVDTVVFDKTGTLTKGDFEVSGVNPIGMDENALLRAAASAESFSDHPISASLKRAYRGELLPVSDSKEFAGLGVEAVVEGKRMLAGNARLMERENIPFTPANEPGTAVYVAADGRFLGYIIISDTVKPNSARAVSSLRQKGVGLIAMLTGDSKRVGEAIALELGIDRVEAELLPDQKVERLEAIMAANPHGKTAFVGDGINDAPVLARADVGIAMGGLGSDAAIEAADVVLMTDEPSRVSEAIAIARGTLAIIRQNIALSLVIKGAVLLLSAFGYASMWAAVFADVGVAVMAILNSMRALKAPSNG